MTKQITAVRGLWDSLTFGGNSRDAHRAAMTAISESIEGGWMQRRRYSAGLLALRPAYNLLLLSCLVAYLYVGMTVIKDGSLHGQDAVRQLVVLACGLGSMKVFHTGHHQRPAGADARGGHDGRHRLPEAPPTARDKRLGRRPQDAHATQQLPRRPDLAGRVRSLPGGARGVGGGVRQSAARPCG